MEELYEGIRTEGLQNPPTVRWTKESGYQLIRGERRVRCLLKLVVDSKNTLCLNQETKQWDRPEKVYNHIPCHVIECEDIEAQKIAFSDNEQAVGFSEACTAAFVRNLKLQGRSDDEIMRITGKRQSWLRDTHTINGLDKECRIAFESRSINRTVALDLSKIEKLPERLEKLKEINAHAILRQKTKVNLAEEQSSIAEANVELAMANLATADDEDEAEEAQSKLEGAKSTLSKKEAEFEKLRNQKPKGTSKDLHATGVPKLGLSMSRLEKAWLIPLQEMLAAKDDDLSEIQVRLALHLVEAILEGRSDVKEVLLDFE
jgi:ParB-like chromosome segregation protein Spo0J